MKDALEFRAFKFVFVPLMVIALLAQLAVTWSQREYLASGYFDFVIYYTGAKIINDGKGRDLFKLDLQRAYQKDFGVARLNIDVPFNHAPYELLIFLPLVYFSYPLAHLIWSTLNGLLLLLILKRLATFIDAKQIALYGLMAFAFFPAMMALKMGQDSVLSTLLLAEAFISLKLKKDTQAGALLALGLYKPQLVLPMAGILFFERRWKAVLAFAVCGAVLVAISLMMVGWRGALDLASLWQSMGNRGGFIWPELMMNIRGLLYVMLDAVRFPAATNLVTLLASFVLCLCTLALWRGPWVVDDALFNLRFSLGIVTTVLVGFHLYFYDALILVIAFILLLDQVLSNRIEVPMTGPIIFAILIALYVPLLSNFLLSRFLLAWQTVPILLFYVALAIEIRNAQQRAIPL